MMLASNKCMANVCRSSCAIINGTLFCCGNEIEVNNKQAKEMLSHRTWNVNCENKISMHMSNLLTLGSLLALPLLI
jgi:hypothetical protein